jgi:alkaline phosphatase D
MRIHTLLAVALTAVPAAAEPPLARIAFGSCASQEKAQPVWDAVADARPNVFVFAGSAVYGDTENADILKAKYAQLGAVPGFQKLLAGCPVFATWDEHDYGVHTGGTEHPQKAAAQKVFLDFFREPAESPRWKRPGVYAAQVYGPPGQRVQIVLLDTRYFRSPLKRGPSGIVPNTDADATVLGADQWRWLEQQLRTPAELRLLVSSIQVVAEDHPFEKWANFPRERDRLFQLLRDTQAEGVIVLSGNRLLAELSEMDAGLGYPLFDLTAAKW